MRKNTKRNFRINVILIISAVVTFTLLAVCVFLEHQSNYLIGTKFALVHSNFQKYNIELPESFNYESGTIIPVSNYNEYKKISKYYKFNNISSLTKQDFKENNYLYIIMSESSCNDSHQFEYYLKNGNNIEIYLSRNNCFCKSTKTETHVYEITFREDITKDMTFSIKFLDTQNDNLNNCNLNK